MSSTKRARRSNTTTTTTTSPWHATSVTSTSGLSPEQLDELFNLTDIIKSTPPTKLLEVLRGKLVALCFLEPSTRTCVSFAAAVQRLGGNVVNISSETSSVAKGETLGDTVRTLQSYADAIVLRHPKLGSADEAAKVMTKPLINAGDGAGEHPTQALLDLYTVLRCCSPSTSPSQNEVINVTFLGDAKYGRTVHSLSKLFATYAPKRFRVRYVAPEASLVMPADLVTLLTNLGLHQSEHSSLDDEDVLTNTDVLYVTRVQKERFQDLANYEIAKKSFLVNQSTLARFTKSNTLHVMHPLPRVGEIAEDVDNDPRAKYFLQMENGMYVRMALMTLVLKGGL